MKTYVIAICFVESGEAVRTTEARVRMLDLATRHPFELSPRSVEVAPHTSFEAWKGRFVEWRQTSHGKLTYWALDGWYDSKEAAQEAIDALGEEIEGRAL